MIVNEMMRLHIVVKNKTQGEVAEDIGIGSSSLTRFMAGKTVEQEAVIKIISWLFSPGDDTETNPEPQTEEPNAQG